MEPIPPDPISEVANPETAPEVAQEIDKAETLNGRAEAFENLLEDNLILDTEESIAGATNGRMETLRKEARENSEEVSDEELWKRAYEEESVGEWNKFAEEHPDKVEEYRKEKERWYKKALVKAQEVMGTIDPGYKVTLRQSIVSPLDLDKAEYRDISLFFKSPQGLGQSWAMEIGPSDDYIENRLPGVIKKVYEEKQAKESILEPLGERRVKGIRNINFDLFPTKEEKYFSGALDRLDQLDQIKADIGVEDGYTGMLRQLLLGFKGRKRFILDRGTIRQRTLEISSEDGSVLITEKIAFGNRSNVWRFHEDGKFSGPENESTKALRQLLKDFNDQAKGRSGGREVVARPE